MQSLRPVKKHRNRIRLTLSLVVLILAGILLFAYFGKVGPFSSSEPSSPTKTSGENDDGLANPTDLGVKPPADGDPTSNSIKDRGEDQTPPSTTENNVEITFAGVIDASTFRVRTLIGLVTSSGTCSLSMTKSGSAPYAASAGVQAMASSSTCKGFDIPLSSLGSGTWKISVTYTNGGESSTATKEVVIDA